MTDVLTPNRIARTLMDLARELDTAVQQIQVADRDLVEKRGAADLAYSRAFLAAEGSMDVRRHTAVVQTHQQRMDADVADALVRHLRRRIDALKVRVDTGRSLGAAVRAEISLAGQGDGP